MPYHKVYFLIGKLIFTSLVLLSKQAQKIIAGPSLMDYHFN